MSQKVYLTTTLPYVNAAPHLGHALEFVQADIYARYQKILGNEVLLNTGTDEHGAKVYAKALAEGERPRVYSDRQDKNFKKLIRALGLVDNISFVRTTSPAHIKAAQEFWRRAAVAGDIYKKDYRLKYCVGCELEKTDSDLVDGRCPIHPQLELEIREEENYFFRFSKYQNKLLELYQSKSDFVLPAYRLNEIKMLITSRGLEDFSISRLAAKMPWGVPVPDDPNQVMYVWFDALISYISALDWPETPAKFEAWWPVIQFAGKDQVRQQAAMWQAMLLSVGLPPSKQIVIHGFINIGGQKMSKSLGNVLDPNNLVADYGTEATRFYLASLHPFEDNDVTLEKIKETYNAKLANGLGNLVSRIMTMASANLSSPITVPPNTIPQTWKDLLATYEFQKTLDFIWEQISALDLRIQATQPFKLIKTDKDQALKIITELVTDLYTIGRMLNPVMPTTSQTIKDLVKNNKMPETPLFARRD